MKTYNLYINRVLILSCDLESEIKTALKEYKGEIYKFWVTDNKGRALCEQFGMANYDQS